MYCLWFIPLNLWWPFNWCNFDNLCKTFVSSRPGKGAELAFEIFIDSSYVVISVLNTFQVAIVLKNINILD